MKGWDILVMWKDGTTNWVSLKEMKASHPIKLAEYAVNNKIDAEPLFAWWVTFTLKHTRRIMSKAKSKYWLTSHKFGIKISQISRRGIGARSDEW